MRSSRHVGSLVALTTAAVLALGVGAAPAFAHDRPADKVPVAVGTGGAVATVDADATRVGLDVLRTGGNAVDAAVAAAATLGVTEPFSSGIGGGGFFVYYDAASGQVHTIDGRETAPAAMQSDAFIENGRGDPVRRRRDVRALRRRARHPADLGHARSTQWGTLDLSRALAGATEVARRGFVVDQTFADQVDDERGTVRRVPVHARSCTCPAAPRPPSGPSSATATWPARTTCWRARASTRSTPAALARDIVDTVQDPPVARRSTLVVRPGLMELGDLAAYRAPLREPTHVSYRGLDVYGMAPPSSGGSTVGEALNILETADLGRARPDPGAAPLPRGERPRLRRPQPLRGRPRLRRRPAGASCSPTGSPPSAPA